MARFEYVIDGEFEGGTFEYAHKSGASPRFFAIRTHWSRIILRSLSFLFCFRNIFIIILWYIQFWLKIYLIKFFRLFSLINEMIKSGTKKAAIWLFTRTPNHVRLTVALASGDIARRIVRATWRTFTWLTTVRIVTAQTKIARL